MSNPLEYYEDALLMGYSRSGVATYVLHKPTGLVFDLGFCPARLAAQRTVMLTHTHLDHAGGLLPYLQYRSLAGMHESPVVHVPHHSHGALCALTKSMERMDHEHNTHSRVMLVPTLTGERILHGYPGSRERYEIEVLCVDHVVDSVGYRVTRHGMRLKAAYKGLPQQELVALKYTGTEIMESVVTGSFLYIGDSTPQPFEDDPSLWHADTVVMESTYLTAHPKADVYGHTELPRLMESLRSVSPEQRPKRVYLKHFSARYSIEEIHREVARYRIEGLPVKAMLPPIM
jgi:ribonuclease Z